MWAAFLAHQFIEFSLKGCWLAGGKKPPQTHNLIRLAVQVQPDAPQEVLWACGQLMHLYYARYPEGVDDKIESDAIQKNVEVIRQWMVRGSKT